jgi:hypothetical protein
VSPKAVPFGAIDAKIASWQSVVQGYPTVWAISGPTHEQQPVFSWLPQFPNVTRDGVPGAFPFEWVTIESY